MGLGSSSAMENAMGQAQRGYQSDLAQLGYQNHWNRQNQLMGMLNQGMQPQFQYSYTQPQQSEFMQVLPAIISAIVGISTGNPMGALGSLPEILKLLGGQQGQQGQFNAGGPLPGLSPQQPIKLF